MRAGKGKTAGLIGALALSVVGAAGAQERTVVGKTADGTQVESILLRDGSGMQARVLTLGAALHSLEVPDRDGKFADVLLGDGNLQATLDNPQYFGTIVGRFANRIAKGRFTLDGKTYQVPVNNGVNSLRGGPRGFDKVVWKIVEATPDHATLQHVSPDGEMGFPGTLTVTATYALKGNGRLEIDYRATTDAPTIVNLSNHAYWNLSGEGSGSAMEHELTIPASAYTPVDKTLIPTGVLQPVEGTVFDFRKAKPRARDLPRGDHHNWVISKAPVRDLREVARVHDPRSGRVMTLLSTQPGLQFYSGNFLDGSTVGKSGRVYRQGDAIALEPQLFPDTPNQPAFGSARLAPGETYLNRIVYDFSTDRDATPRR